MRAAAHITMGFVGTPDYASPEQIEEKPLDTRSDIYSLAATMWYALTGAVMFTGTVPQVMAQQMDRPPRGNCSIASPRARVAPAQNAGEGSRATTP